MKLKPFIFGILLVILALLISGCSLFFRDQTSTVEPSEPENPITSPNLIYFDMNTVDEGWGLTEKQVLKTNDGGRIWEDVTPEGVTSVDYRASKYFLDAANGWVLIPEADISQTGMLYRTADSGQTWSRHDAPFSSANLFFVDNLFGYALYNTGAGAGSATAQIFRTENGGESWSLVYEVTPDSTSEETGIPFSGSKDGISFRDDSHGYVSGSVPADGFVYLYETRDGGVSWSQVEIELPAMLQNSLLSFQPPQFFNDQMGKFVVRYFGADEQGTILFTTNNGGEEWMATWPIETMGRVSLVNMQTTMIWDGAIIFGTNDGGVTWRSYETNIDISDSISQLIFPVKNTGYALYTPADGASTLYTTRRNLYNWQELP